MSSRDECNSVRDFSDNQSFSFSNTKNKINNTNIGKNSSSKKKGKSSKIFFDKKQNEINEKVQIKTPQSQASRIKKIHIGDRFIPVRTNEENSSNIQYMLLQNNLNANNNSNLNANTSQQNGQAENLSQVANPNNINNYQNLMMDSLLLRSSSESFSIDRNNIKNMTMFNENHRERVLSFNSCNINNSHTQKSKNPKSFINQIKTMAENKSLTDTFHLDNKYTAISSRLKEISLTPERILDAPQLIDDYYLNLIDWSSQNVLAVSLGNSVYLWNGNTLETVQLMSNQDNICSVNWMDSGNCLAVGMKNGHIELWDSIKHQQIRDMEGHTGRVCSLSWNNYLLSSGSKDTKIINHDVRVRNHIVNHLVGHTQEVCALKWSPDGSLLASGGNDNLLCVWDINYANNNTQSNINNRIRRSEVLGANLNQFVGGNTGNFLGGPNSNIASRTTEGNFLSSSNLNNNINNNLHTRNLTSSIWNIIEENDAMGNLYNSPDSSSPINNPSDNLNNPNINSNNSILQIAPKYTFTQHDAAVKALAWCPWQKGLLASGAGSKDKTIKFWNIDNGSLINSIDTGSQVCALLWNKQEKELISSHGYSKHQISIWKYPSMFKLTELNGHMSRVLYLAMSPDGCSIVSGAGDETLRFWKIQENKKTPNESVDFKILNNFQIR